MAILKWDPFKELQSLQEKIDRIFEETLRGREPAAFSGSWVPAVDIYETDDAIVLEAELPGMDEKDIEVRVEDNVLTIKGERKFEKEAKEENYYRMERYYGSFQRSFSLPSNVDVDKIKAEYKKGILKVTMPKKEETKPKQIKIEVEK